MNQSHVRIERVADAAQIAAAGAAIFARVAQASIAARGVCRVALSGGSTPKALYRLLTTPDPAWPAIEWTRVELFFGDERHVPPDHADSNYRMVQESLLAHVPIPEAHVHRMRTEWPEADHVAAQYEQTLDNVFGLASGDGEVLETLAAAAPNARWPRFDLVLLGMGTDGHTASLFPHTTVLAEHERLAAAVWVEKMHTWRVTLTVPVLNHARHTVVLVGGADKAETLQAVLEGPRDPDRLPIQRIAPVAGDLTWLVDTAAAARLRPAASLTDSTNAAANGLVSPAAPET